MSSSPIARTEYYEAERTGEAVGCDFAGRHEENCAFVLLF